MRVVDEVCASVPELKVHRDAIACINNALMGEGFERRELRAWALAETFIEAYLRDLLEHLENFTFRKEFCLRTYVRSA